MNNNQKSVFIIFPIDLYNDLSYIKKSKVFLIEEEHYFNRHDKKLGSFTFNALKPIYHRATMQSYYNKLVKRNIDCEYVEINHDWINIVQKYIKKHDIDILMFFDPVDRYLENKIKKNFQTYDVINTPRFILTTEDMESYSGVLRQTSFYSWIREYKQILMDKDNKPFGGKLTYDKDNRKAPYEGIENDIATINKEDKIEYTNNKYVQEAIKYVKKYFNENQLHFNEDIILKFPIDRKGSLNRLNYFIEHKLKNFGDYQDVIINDPDNSFVFHSALSPMLNIGLLTPDEIIDAVLASKFNKNTIHNVEGYIRQILGWREFTRYMYQYHSNMYMNKNFFKAEKKLDVSWYDGSTAILPLDVCIKKAFKFGYLHHIERLMIVANYMTLIGISPHNMYKWFMEFSLDSYDWVMEFNVYCMASYSDGGQFTSKPYISSSHYIRNMSNYKTNNEWTEKWDKLFWKFMKKHKNKIKKIGRLAGLLKNIKDH